MGSNAKFTGDVTRTSKPHWETAAGLYVIIINWSIGATIPCEVNKTKVERSMTTYMKVNIPLMEESIFVSRDTIP